MRRTHSAHAPGLRVIRVVPVAVERWRALGLRAFVAATAACALAATSSACRTSPSAPPRPYNVLLVSLDTVRQDVLGAYGHRPRHAPDAAISPAFDQLAHESVRMADAYSSSAWTLPAHLSMMTGLPALAHAVDTENGILDPAIPTLAETLSRRGYRTIGVYSAPFLDPHWGFGRGFDSYTAVYGAETAAASERNETLRRDSDAAAAAGDWARYDALKREQAEAARALDDRSETIVTSDQVAHAAVAALQGLAHEGRPWFLFAHFFDAHCDYVPPPPYDTRFDPDYRGTFTGANCMGGPEVGSPDPASPGALLRTLGDRDLEHAFALYEGEVGWVDDHLGTILRALDQSGMADDTLVIVVADHGEEFFEHAGLGHRRTLYDEVVRVPMVLRLPHVLPAGRTVTGPVSLTDLVPTVEELLGPPAAPTVGSTSFAATLRDGSTVDHPVLLRTVIMFGGTVSVDQGAPVAVRQVVVQDGFRTRDVEITRRRSWPQFEANLSPDMEAVLQREAATQYGRETLRWTDAAHSPGEPARAWSSDFSTSTARAALASFHDAYAAALARRPAEQRSAVPHNVRSKLESLGYLAREGGPTFPEPDLVLPPPGDGAPASPH